MACRNVSVNCAVKVTTHYLVAAVLHIASVTADSEHLTILKNGVVGAFTTLTVCSCVQAVPSSSCRHYFTCRSASLNHSTYTPHLATITPVLNFTIVCNQVTPFIPLNGRMMTIEFSLSFEKRVIMKACDLKFIVFV